MDRQKHGQQDMIIGHSKTSMDLTRASSKHSIRIRQIPDLAVFSLSTKQQQRHGMFTSLFKSPQSISWKVDCTTAKDHMIVLLKHIDMWHERQTHQ